MPTPYVKKLAKKHRVSVPKSEGKWKAAKKAAADQGKGDDYAYIMGVYNRMMHESSFHLAAVSRLMTKAAIHIDPKNRGKLHRHLGIPEDQPIPVARLKEALKSDNPEIVKEANFALNARKWKK